MYIEYIFSGGNTEQYEILMALLSDFNTFLIEENQLYAYTSDVEADILSVQEHKQTIENFGISFSKSTIEKQNWNKEWESHYEPVLIDNCVVRAAFHSAVPAQEYEIFIEPKMSFGTAHHETTHLCIKMMLSMDFHRKNVCDLGCGTAILAILAEKLGAERVLAIDNDEWAYENSKENMAKNNCKNLSVTLGDVHKTGDEKFDVFIANINRNVLLEQMQEYAKHVKQNGFLLLSGFYLQDFDILRQKAATCNLEPVLCMSKSRWMAAKFKKL